MARGSRTLSLAVVAVAHVAAATLLLRIDAVRQPLAEAVPLMVNLVTPPKPEPPRPPHRPPPAPLPRAAEPPPLLALPAQVAAPAPMVAVPAAAPPSRLEALPPVEAPRTAAPMPAPAPVVPPSFNAAYLQNPPPAYPALSRRRGERGRVLLRVFVNERGGAERLEVRTSSGFERLDEAALDAVRQWRFVPARQGTEAVAAWVLVPIDFELGS